MGLEKNGIRQNMYKPIRAGLIPVAQNLVWGQNLLP